MAFSPDNDYVKIFYHSPYAPHTMEIPTRHYTPDGTGATSGTFDDWSGGVVSADAMINELVTIFASFFNSFVTFDSYIIYSNNNDAGIVAPVYSAALAITGVNSSTSWFKAVQFTWSFRTTLFNQSKIVFLDAPSNNNYDKVTTVSAGSPQEDLVNAFTSSGNGWAGRDDQRPATFAQYAITLNEKLRRSYRMN